MAECITDRFGDVVAAHFLRESEVVLFLPYSGEVLLGDVECLQAGVDEHRSPLELSEVFKSLGVALD